MKPTRKYLELEASLTEKYKLPTNQSEPILKLYLKTKDDVAAIDQAQRFKDINDGKKVRDFLFVYTNECNKKRGVYKLSFDSNFKIHRN
jgi:hypothetical protein